MAHPLLWLACRNVMLLPCRSFKSICAKSILSVTISTISLATILRVTHLYIHPLDLVTHLFGKPEILACQQVAPASYIIMLRHSHIVGTLELSTAYTWTAAEESLKICTSKGIYRLSQMEQLTFEPKPSTILGIPIEKVHPHNKNIEYLYVLNNFIPVFPNNQIYSQGYFNELSAFVEAVEGNNANIVTSLESVRDAYLLIEKIKSH